MTVIVKNDMHACFPNGQVVINLSRQPKELQKKKMELALSTFRRYGWSIDDRRTPISPAIDVYFTSSVEAA